MNNKTKLRKYLIHKLDILTDEHTCPFYVDPTESCLKRLDTPSLTCNECFIDRITTKIKKANQYPKVDTL